MAIEGVFGTGLEAQSSQTDAVKSLIRWESPHPLSIAGVDYGYRVGFGKAGFPGSWSRQGRAPGVAQAASAQPGIGLLCQTVAVPDRARSLCRIALLGTRAAGSGP